MKVSLSKDFRRLLIGDLLSEMGTAISSLAIPLLVINTLSGSAADVGAVRAFQWAPYIGFGLLGGVWVERVRRRPVLIASDLALAACFGSIAGLALLGWLSLPVLWGLVFVAGSVTCLQIAAFQSFVPRLVHSAALPSAFAKFGQVEGGAASTGPFLGGSCVKLFGAPVAIGLDALSYLWSALWISRIHQQEPQANAPEARSLLAELRGGIAWVYGHETLRPYAFWLHSDFFFVTFFDTVLVYYATVELGLDALQVGLILAVQGVSITLAASVAPWLSLRWPVGKLSPVVQLSVPVGILVVLLNTSGPWAISALVCAMVLTGLPSINGGDHDELPNRSHPR